MDVIKAILARRSVRDFSSKTVPKETVMKILETATHSPSGSNTQPWEVFVASGDTLERIRNMYQERRQPEAGSFNRPVQSGQTPPPAYIQERAASFRNERLRFLGLDPADPSSSKVLSELVSRLYGTPLLIVICMDKYLTTNTDLLNIGLFTQTICLAAQGYGVDSFIATALVSKTDILRQELEIPENLNIITGVGLGYPNKSLINKYRSSRRPVQEVVRYKI